MKIFKGSHTQWFVLVDNRKEKQALFTVIEKREPFSLYFHPDGKRQEQFAITAEEADKINEQIHSIKRGSAGSTQ